MSLNRPKRSKRPRWGIKGLWALLLVALAAGGGAAWYFTRAAGGAADQALVQSTQTAVVKRGTVRITASGSGTLAAIRSADLSFSTGGTISELNVKLGDLVQAGDVLARLSSAEDLEASLASAELQLFQARQSLETIQQNADLELAQDTSYTLGTEAASFTVSSTVTTIGTGGGIGDGKPGRGPRQ